MKALAKPFGKNDKVPSTRELMNKNLAALPKYSD